MKSAKHVFLFLFVALFATGLMASTPPLTSKPPKKVKKDGLKLSVVYEEMILDASLEDAWRILADEYIHVGDFHYGIQKSGGLEGFPEMGDGAGRYCDLNFKNKDITVKEKIIEWNVAENQKEYTYEVFEWNNFPLKKMLNTWGLKKNEQGQTVLYHAIYFRMKPGVMTGPMRGQMKKAATNGMLGYKHFVETGERNVNDKELREQYGI